MVIPRTFISRDVVPTPEGWQVTVWRRPRETIFSKAHYHLFPTEEEARDYLRTVWKDGNLTEEGRKAKFTTRSVWWVSDDLVLTRPYANLPSVTATVIDGIVKVWVDGVQIADNKGTKGLKSQIAAHPLGECLLAETCLRCRRLPIVNLTTGTLTHSHRDCPTKFRMDPHPLITTAVQIALWNREIAGRIIPASARPLLPPDYMVLGVLRQQTETDQSRKIRKIASIVFDKK